jgi:putative DNA primase/helicase
MNIADLKTHPRWVCYTSGKVPIDAKTGRKASSTDSSTWATYAEAARSVGKYSTVGVGFVLTGDGIVGIDLDACFEVNPDGSVTATSLARHALGLSSSYSEISPSGKGLHIIGTATIPESARLKGRTAGGDKVEIYETARYFTFTESITDAATEELQNIQHVVNWLVDQMEQAHSATKLPETAPMDEKYPTAWVRSIIERAMRTGVKMVSDALEGDRHDTRVKAGRLIGGYLAGAEAVGYSDYSDDDVVDALYNAQVPRTGAQRAERKAIADGVAYGRKSPIVIPQPKERIAPPVKSSPTVLTETTESVETVEDEETYHLTDLGNGRRLVRACGDKLCYVAEWKQWLVWDGQRWAKGDDAGVVRLAHRVALDIYTEIADEPDSDRRKDITKWAVASESAMRIDAMIKSARPYLTKAPNIFDTHAHLLNVTNGTVNLQTMKMAKHDPAQFLTKIVDVEYDEHASMSPRWAKFLRTIFDNDNELEGYVQRAVGYTLTGHTDEHCLFFCYGDGANGKSTFMKALEIISGEFSTTASIEALLEKRNDGDNATPTVAGLVGMRLATAQEMPDGKRFDESLIKSITGGDTISARVLYGSIFKFVPTHTLWLTGNHKPRITGTDAGIWRRIRIVPFIANIPEDQRRDSREIAKEFHEDASAILQWAVLGAYLWYKNGLGSCEAVDRATTEYRGEEDIVARFIQTMCVIGESKRVAKTVLYAAWKEWAEDEGERGAAFKSQRWVLRQLETRKIVIAHDRRFVHGIGLVEEREESSEPMAQLTRGQRRRAEA